MSEKSNIEKVTPGYNSFAIAHIKINIIDMILAVHDVARHFYDVWRETLRELVFNYEGEANKEPQRGLRGELEFTLCF